jgi:hypothetical protein
MSQVFSPGGAGQKDTVTSKAELAGFCMLAGLRRSLAGSAAVAAVLAAVMFVAVPGTAEAVPLVQYVESMSNYDSVSPKMAVAECPAGMWVLGGSANIAREQGQIAIQGAFPMYDAVTGTSKFVVKASEDVGGTAGNWRVIAGAYCTDTFVMAPVSWSTPFDSTTPKSIPAPPCPGGMSVVGLGAEVSMYPDPPDDLAFTTPTTNVVLQGVDVNAALGIVVARATEHGAWANHWMLTAVAVCGYPQLFEGLQRVAAKVASGPADETHVEASCPAGKRPLAVAAKNQEGNLGEWYLDRFGKPALALGPIVAESFRNSGVSTNVNFLYIICSNS